MPRSIFPPDDTPRIWCPVSFADRRARPFRVSFLIAEEATWDHRFHAPDGREIPSDELQLSADDQRLIQASCDGGVGATGVRLRAQPANDAGGLHSLAATLGSSRA